jgi:hypothetical protein
MAGTAFTSVALTGSTLASSKEGLKRIFGTASGPSTAGADTTLSVASFTNGKVYDLAVQPISGTTWLECQPIIGTGAPASVKVNIFSGTSAVAQDTSDLSSTTFAWEAICSDYE